MSKPKTVELRNGVKVEVHTPFTTRAKELMQLYNGLNLPMLTVDERLDVLLHIKWTVKVRARLWDDGLRVRVRRQGSGVMAWVRMRGLGWARAPLLRGGGGGRAKASLFQWLGGLLPALMPGMSNATRQWHGLQWHGLEGNGMAWALTWGSGEWWPRPALTRSGAVTKAWSRQGQKAVAECVQCVWRDGKARTLRACQPTP